MNQVPNMVLWWLWVIGFATIAVASFKAAIKYYYKEKAGYNRKAMNVMLDFNEASIRMKKRLEAEDHVGQVKVKVVNTGQWSDPDTMNASAHD